MQIKYANDITGMAKVLHVHPACISLLPPLGQTIKFVQKTTLHDCWQSLNWLLLLKGMSYAKTSHCLRSSNIILCFVLCIITDSDEYAKKKCFLSQIRLVRNFLYDLSHAMLNMIRVLNIFLTLPVTAHLSHWWPNTFSCLARREVYCCC